MFDSGFGGLTVARALIDLLPGEDLIYLGDTGRYPYGPRDLAEVAGFAHQITEELVERRGVKLVVVACNTAAAAALDSLRDRFDVPIVGVIDPGVRALGQATRTGRVGVIGTVGTINSGAYQAAVAVRGARRGPGRVGLPRVRRVRRTWRVRLRTGPRAGHRAARPGPGGRGRRAAARLHALPVPGTHAVGRHGSRRRAGVERGRDRVRGAPTDAGRRVGGGSARTRCRAARRRSSPPGTSTGSRSWADGCSDPSWSVPSTCTGTDPGGRTGATRR